MKLKYLLALLFAFAFLAPLTTARADDDVQTLKKRAQDRYPKLRQAKDQGKIGETWGGMVEAVDPKFLGDADLSQLIHDEVTDRTALYQIIAKQTGTTPEEVAKRAGQRNFSTAQAGDYLKGEDGKWTRKS